MKKKRGQDLATKIKTVNAFQTSEGEIFLDQEEARKHQAALDLKEKIEAFVARHFWSGISTYDIVDLLVEHGTEIGIK